MKKFIIYNLCILSLFSCEKIWVEELHERACDKIRGLYEPVSIVWEEPEPIDIDGDGVASFDYLAEWEKIFQGSPGDNIINNDHGTLDIPYIRDLDAEETDSPWYSPDLAQWHIKYDFNIRVVIEGNESHLEFDLPDDGSEFCHTGPGEITLRTKVTLTTLTESGTTKDVTGTIFIKYVRTQYIAK